MCEQCKFTRDFGDPAFIASPGFQEALDEFASRVKADPPIRICDDPVAWDWRAYLRARTNGGPLEGEASRA